MATELKEKLDAKIPRAAISSRSAGNGVTLDYLTGFYVIARLNEVLGQGNWEYTVEDLSKVFEGEVNGRYATSYIAKVGLTANLSKEAKPATNPDGSISYYSRFEGKAYFSDYGYGDGTDKINPGKAHELAVKEAITDGVKRCAKNLGMSLGLALYDKTQENVEDEQITKGTMGSTTTIGASAGSSSAAAHVNSNSEGGGNERPTGDTRKLIRSAVAVLNAQKKISVDNFKEKYTQGRSADQLNDTEITTLYKRISQDYPELKLK